MTMCNQCGRENCNGHICAACGKDAETPLMVEGKFYCDKFCLYSKDSSHPQFANANDDFKVRADITARMRALREEAREAGVAWLTN